MRKILVALAFLIGLGNPVYASTYYLSPSGSDSNSGTSTSAAWLSPNHSVNCGDIILASAGSYSNSNFASGKWGTVSNCSAAGSGVAWLKCTTFDTCKITTSSGQGMLITNPYWGIQGWEVTVTSGGYTCFSIQPVGSQSIHHIIFANNVANGCQGSGFGVYQASSTAVSDYIMIVGNIAYNAAQGSYACYSGITVGFNRPYDTVAGTHMYIAGNFSYANTDPSTCAGGKPTDGEGILYDTLKEYLYSQQVVMQNNILVFNGGRGGQINNNNGSSYATGYIKSNTMYANNQQAGQAYPTTNGDLTIVEAYGITATGNLAMTNQATTGGSAIYAASLNGGNSTDIVNSNVFYSLAGNTTYGSGFGTNITANPGFANPVNPGAPNCSGTANVPACMTTLIANFKPSSTYSTYGYQTPSNTSITDSLFPSFLCNGSALIANFPQGLVTPGCGGTVSTTVTPSMSASQIQTILNQNQGAIFAQGTYSNLGSTTLNFPCINGVTYTGPNVGILTTSNQPTAIITNSDINIYSFAVNSNGTSNTTVGTYACHFNYFLFSGQHGGIFVNAPSSGVDIQNNGFTLNDATILGTTSSASSNANPNIWVDGSSNTAATGTTNDRIDSNWFYNECANVRAQAYPDSGGYCSAVWINYYNNYVKLTNNTINLIEEGFKGAARSGILNVMNNIDVENNQCQGNSRICMEFQHNSNGNSIWNHNAFFKPFNPSYNTFELSLPIPQSTSPTSVANDNVFIGNVPPTVGGSGSRYGIGLEAWGVGFSGKYNLFQGQNGTPTCVGTGGYCESWAVVMGGPNTSQSWTNNTFTGSETNSQTTAFSVENGGVLGNATLTPNTYSSTSATIAVGAPTITPASGTGVQTVTLTAPDTNHNYTLFYTTDGTTPTSFSLGSSAGSTKVYNGSFSVPSGATVNAISSWGQGANQGIIFPSFGYVSSSVATVTYSGGGGSPTLLSGYLNNPGSVNTAVAGGPTIQFIAYGNYSSGTTPLTLPDTYGNTANWSSDTPSVCTVSNSGLFTPVSAGTCNVKVVSSPTSIAFNPYTMTVTAAPPTLQSISIVSTGGITTLSVGSTNQLIATGHYSDGSTSTITSLISTWSTSNSSFATISGGGLVTGIAAGSVTFTGTYKSVTSNSLPLNISSSVVIQSITVTNPGNVTLMYLNWTLPFNAQCNYSDGSNTQCNTTDTHNNIATWASSNTGAATFSSNILKEISATAGNGYINASAGGITSAPFQMLYTGAGPITFTLTGATVIITGNTVTLSYH